VFDPSPEGCGYTILIEDSEYIVLEGFKVRRSGTSGGRVGIEVQNAHHLVLSSLEVSETGQEGMHIGKRSTYIDVLGNHVFDTGKDKAKWGECVYAGTGSSADFPDNTENIWIEGNVLHACGSAEAINIKTEVFNATIRGNTIYDISPGTSDQYNQAAITIEGGRGDDYLPDTRREVWVEGNALSDIRFGHWANAIMVGGMGVYVLENVIEDYEEGGIYVNAWGDLGLPVYVFGNTVDGSGETDYYFSNGVDVRLEDPGSNPMMAQDGYSCGG
jgi:hypothetical protein